MFNIKVCECNSDFINWYATVANYIYLMYNTSEQQINYPAPIYVYIKSFWSRKHTLLNLQFCLFHFSSYLFFNLYFKCKVFKFMFYFKYLVYYLCFGFYYLYILSDMYIYCVCERRINKKKWIMKNTWHIFIFLYKFARWINLHLYQFLIYCDEMNDVNFLFQV